MLGCLGREGEREETSDLRLLTELRVRLRIPEVGLYFYLPAKLVLHLSLLQLSLEQDLSMSRTHSL